MCDKNFVCGNILTGFFIYIFNDQRDKIMICSNKKKLLPPLIKIVRKKRLQIVFF